MLEVEIALHIAARVPFKGIVVGIHRYAAKRETQFAVWRESTAQDFVLFIAGEHAKRTPVLLVESGAPTAECGDGIVKVGLYDFLAVG